MEKPPVSLCKATMEDGDYYNEMGLLVCGKCHTTKEQTMYKPQGFEMFRRLESDPAYVIYPKNCDCRKADIEARATESKATAARLQGEILRRSLSDAQYKETNFAMDDGRDEKTTAFCRNYVDKWETAFKENHGIMFYGMVGSGKTFFSSCIANALVDKGKTVMMTTIGDLELAMYKDFRKYKAEIMQNIRTVQCLILDDFGKEQLTKEYLEATYEIINTRYKAKKPLIITTNLTRRAMQEEKTVGLRRIFSRLEEMCVPVLVESVDRRTDNGEEKIKRAYALYGK
jgi:DNA replication protein DnaC